MSKVRPSTRKILPARGREVVGEITHGCDIYAMTMGLCSLVEIIAVCLEATGPAAIELGFWTCALPDVEWLAEKHAAGTVTDITWILDNSIWSRPTSAAVCEALIGIFGDERIFATSIHCKFVTIRNDRWNLAIRTSANLNINRRIEYVEISDSLELCESLGAFVNLVKEAGFTLEEGSTNRAMSEDSFWSLGGKPKMRNAQLGYGMKQKGITYGIG